MVHHYQSQVVQVGEHREQPCYMIDLGHETPEVDYPQRSLRGLLMQTGPAMFEVAARAWQVALFLRTHRFCGRCGSTMHNVDWEMAVQCSNCQHRCYPRISPCIIVAIVKDQQLLLAQGKAHQKNTMYSVLAGFVESGETLEQAVHREVYEEVGIKVQNLRYFGSQPWPFPHSLMVGFIADYKSGEIAVDGKEILTADWFDLDNLPTTPPTLSIAGQLIETCKNQQQPK